MKRTIKKVLKLNKKTVVYLRKDSGAIKAGANNADSQVDSRRICDTTHTQVLCSQVKVC